MSYSFTGSMLRDAAVLDAAQACVAEGKAPTYGYIAEKVADKFADLGDDEVEAVNAYLDSASVKAPPVEQAELPPDSGDVRPAEPVEDESLRSTWPPETVSMPVEETSPAPMTREDVRVQMLDLQNRLNDARGAVVRLQQKLRDARGAAARAVTDWQGCFKPMTHEQLVREHIASEQARKQAMKDGLIPPKQMPRVGNSFFDRMGSYGAGDASTFVRKRMQRGGSRGAYGKHMLGVKLPSGVKA